TIKYSKDILTKPIYPIQKVIVVYPGQEDVNGIISKDWDDFIFIQLRPDENGGIYGYKELQQALIRK
ncbi:MAG: hypothetical protein RR645_03150, partial [Clostridium sp.]